MTHRQFNDIFMPHHRMLYGLALSILHDDREAADCIQEAFTRLWDRRRDMKHIDNHKAYAAITVRNIALGMLALNSRSVSFSQSPLPEDPDVDNSPLRITEARDDLRTVVSLLNELPENQRKIILMTATGGLSATQISEATGLSEQNIRVLLSRARKRLKTLFSLHNNSNLLKK